MNRSQCYKLLGLDEGASINQIKDAYRKLALEYHPDKNISAKDGEKFKMIYEAYHVLREKNNSSARIYSRTEYHTNKNHQNKKNSFPAWLNLYYAAMHYTCTRYVKNIYHNYLKYEPVFFEYCDKTKRNVSLTIHRLIRFLPYNHIKILFLNYIKMTKDSLTRI